MPRQFVVTSCRLLLVERWREAADCGCLSCSCCDDVFEIMSSLFLRRDLLTYSAGSLQKTIMTIWSSFSIAEARRSKKEGIDLFDILWSAVYTKLCIFLLFTVDLFFWKRSTIIFATALIYPLSGYVRYSPQWWLLCYILDNIFQY